TSWVPRGRFDPPAPSTTWERDVAILKIPTFTPSAAAAIRKELDEASRRSIDRIIIDLRGSIGGSIADAAPAASLFVPKGPIATVVSRKASEKPLQATGDPVWEGQVGL